MSGVYIPGMEMPKSCYECPIRQRKGLKIVCPILKEEFAVSDVNILFFRLKDCPLIPVPPHGDLIERDKLREKEFINAGDAYAVVMSRDIRNAPTIIPADKEGEG